MVIPVGAPNTAAALAFLNFVYRPEVQADIAAYVTYVTPVDGVQEILTQAGPGSWRNNPLIFPPPALARGLHRLTRATGQRGGPAGGHRGVPGRDHRLSSGRRRRVEPIER